MDSSAKLWLFFCVNECESVFDRSIEKKHLEGRIRRRHWRQRGHIMGPRGTGKPFETNDKLRPGIQGGANRRATGGLVLRRGGAGFPAMFLIERGRDEDA